MKRLRILSVLLLTALLLAGLCLPVLAADPGEDQPIIVPGVKTESSDERSEVPGNKTEAPGNQSEAPGNQSGSPVIDSDDEPAVIPTEKPGAPTADPDDGSGEPAVVPGGENPSDPGQPYAVDGNLIWLTQTMAYDLNERAFSYPVGNSGTVVLSSVADGMIVSGSARVQGKTLIIYRNGALWEGNAEKITEPGNYVVTAQTGNETPRLFSFTLAGSGISSVYNYRMPTGMYVRSVTRDGESAGFQRDSVPMQEDGLYHVTYECIATGVVYELNLNVDRKPPVLRFEGEIDENNRVHSALRFSGLEEEDVIEVLLDGTPLDVTVHADGTGELTQSGSYVITVRDAAGNKSEYGYIIMLYFNYGSIVFFVLLSVSLLALAIYIFIKRKRLEIG